MDKEIIKACIALMEYASLRNATGADFDIATPKGTIHFTYDFTIDLKNQEDD